MDSPEIERQVVNLYPEPYYFAQYSPVGAMQFPQMNEQSRNISFLRGEVPFQDITQYAESFSGVWIPTRLPRLRGERKGGGRFAPEINREHRRDFASQRVPA